MTCNFQIHSVSLTIVVSIHLLIHFSTHLCHHPHSRHPSFTLSLQAQNLPFQQILSTVDFFNLLECLTITGLDRTGPITLIILFLVLHFNFLFVPCGRLSWLPVSFLLHVKHTLSYRCKTGRMSVRPSVKCPSVRPCGVNIVKALTLRSRLLSRRRWNLVCSLRVYPAALGTQLLGSEILNFGLSAARGDPELSPVRRDDPPRGGCLY